jgi:hypothetical protein
MIGGTRILVSAFWLVLAAGNLSAQDQPASSTPAATDSAVANAVPPEVSASIAAPPANAMATRVTLGVAATPGLSVELPLALAQDSNDGGVHDFFFGTQRRTSRTMLIGGAATSIVGVGVVKGEIGAVMGVLGLMSCVGGLYLAF